MLESEVNCKYGTDMRSVQQQSIIRYNPGRVAEAQEHTLIPGLQIVTLVLEDPGACFQIWRIPK